jgi:alginate O-acetyltransferase complex protein AlgI
MVNDTFSRNAVLSGTAAWWMCMFAFAFQIYFDFNGYSSIARGLAKLCGIHFRLNFNHPYLSGSFSEFWKRWHISLSSFFRDYVYIALGGNRKGKLKAELNRWITMLLSGLWHGANFTFLIWGAIHAFFLSMEHHTVKIRKALPAWIKILRYPLVFVSVTLAWVFFRAPDLAYASEVLRRMFSAEEGLSVIELLKSNAAVWLFIAFVSELLSMRSFRRFKSRNVFLSAIFYAVLIAMILFFRGPEQDFIYFQF